MPSNFLKCAVAFAALALPAPLFAKIKPPPPPPPSCSVVTFNVTTVSCLGFFSGNLVAASGPKLTDALTDVGTLDSQAATLISKVDFKPGTTSNIIDFGTDLYGPTVVGIHFGGGNTGYNGTGFWLLNLPTTVDTISYTTTVEKGISDAGLYLTSRVPPPGGVPEPSTWATMLIGFGAVAASIRARRRRMSNEGGLNVGAA